MNGSSCSLAWLEYNLKVLPDLMSDPGCRALLRLINFSRRRDALIHEEGIVISYFTLARCEGQLAAAMQKRYRGSVALLLRIKGHLERAGWRVRWNPPRHEWGQARALFATPPEEYRLMRLRELRGELAGERVMWGTGARWTRRKANAALDELKESARKQVILLGGPLAVGRCAYHNEQPSNAFSRMSEIAKSLIPEAAAIKNPRRREQTLCNLRAIEDFPQPVYAPTARSPRVYQQGMGISSLIKPFRRKVYLRMNWFLVDLKNVQLAAFAAECHAVKLLTFLRGGGNFWEVMSAHCGANLSRIKGTLKKGTYGPCFGQIEPKARKVFCRLMRQDEYGKEEAQRICDLFFGHEYIVELFRERAIKIDWIEAKGFAETCLGERIEVTPKRGAHAVLAACAQAIEQSLMEPIYDLARQSHGEVVIRHNLHDGCGLQIYRRWEWWIERICQAVKDRADERGVPTALSIEINPYTEREEPAPAPVPAMELPADLAPVVLPVGRAALAPRKRWDRAHRELLAVTGGLWPAPEQRPLIAALVAKRTRLRCLAGVPGFFVDSAGLLTFSGPAGWTAKIGDEGGIVLRGPAGEDAFGASQAPWHLFGSEGHRGGWTIDEADAELAERAKRAEDWIRRHGWERRAAKPFQVDPDYRYGEWEEQQAERERQERRAA